MVRDWSRLEVEATVAEYLDMLHAELRGEPYNKAAHRRRLQTLLDDRSEGAIERKHQNISAVLIALGLPYIDGYKPLSNYQQLLYDVVEDRVGRAQELIETVAEQVAEPARIPEIEDILAALEEPPKVDRKALPSWEERRARYRARRAPTRTDYLAREAANASLGAAGEEFVVRFERARLIHAGKENLADRVERVSVTLGDREGFDVGSFDEQGTDRLIEVKTTAYGKETPFYLTRNELEVSRERSRHYHLYRLFRFRADPRLFSVRGALDEVCLLDPVQYVSRVVGR